LLNIFVTFLRFNVFNIFCLTFCYICW